MHSVGIKNLICHPTVLLLLKTLLSRVNLSSKTISFCCVSTGEMLIIFSNLSFSFDDESKFSVTWSISHSAAARKGCFPCLLFNAATVLYPCWTPRLSLDKEVAAQLPSVFTH